MELAALTIDPNVVRSWPILCRASPRVPIPRDSSVKNELVEVPEVPWIESDDYFPFDPAVVAVYVVREVIFKKVEERGLACTPRCVESDYHRLGAIHRQDVSGDHIHEWASRQAIVLA